MTTRDGLLLAAEIEELHRKIWEHEAKCHAYPYHTHATAIARIAQELLDHAASLPEHAGNALAMPPPTLPDALDVIAERVALDATEEAQQEAAVVRQAAAALRAQSQKVVTWVWCAKHYGMWNTVKLPVHTAIKTICPICEQERALSRQDKPAAPHGEKEGGK